jgi:hypothetical protein
LILLAVTLLTSSPLQVTGSDWQDLFDGRTLTGWRAAENPESFKIVDGAIACDGPRAHLFYAGPNGQATFRNFELELEAFAKPGANSGVFFHTTYQEEGWPAQGFEVQINNSQEQHGNYLELKKTGSLYGIRNVHKQLITDNVWFTMRISVRGKQVQVRLNDLLVVDYREPDEKVLTASGAVSRLGEGTFALQCHDPESQALYRSLRVRRLPDNLPTSAPAPVVDAGYVHRIELAGRNFPIINLHAHLKGGLTVDEVIADWLRTGINYGIAINCGVGFPITNDAAVFEFADSMRGAPVFLAMQAEGREWVHMFSKEARQRFDYVFTDAMTFTDARGRRTRLWMPNEVEVGDKQAFMDYLVRQTVTILTNEPIDVYVNPTFLPQVITDEYSILWTEARMQRVIDAAVQNEVAIEINGRYRLPSEKFIRLAKAAGAKFTFGTNNGGRDIGSLDYCLEMQRKCGLRWQDMFVPGVTAVAKAHR